MKLVLVGPAFPYRGGIAQYNTSLFQALRPAHEAHLIGFSRQYPGFLFPGRTQHDASERPLAVPSERLLDSVGPRSWAVTGDRIVSLAPDAVIFQWWQPYFAFAFSSVIHRVRRSLSVPIIFCCHNIFPHDRSKLPPRQWLETGLIRWCFRQVDGFLVHTEGMVEEVRSLRPAASVRRIYHPLYTFFSELESDGVPAGASDRAGGGPPRLLFFGKVRPYKGLETLIQALGWLRRQGFEFRARIAGEFYTDDRRYRVLAAETGAGDWIEWSDRYIPNEEVPTLFEAADVVVLPYVEATQSGVVSVAFQFGVPVIATRVGGLAEVIQEGRTGFLVPPQDPEALGRAVLRYFVEDLKEPFRRNIMEFRRQLTWGQAVDSLLGLVRDLTEGRQARA